MPYSRLTQFNPENVSRLKIAWVLRTGDVSDGKHGKQRSGFETTPIPVDGLPIFATGFKVIAVNSETGKLQWAYDPKIDPTWDYGDAQVNRGLATWFGVAWRTDQRTMPPTHCPSFFSSFLRSDSSLARRNLRISAAESSTRCRSARSSLWPD
jgi:glucose dehydrogenase